MPITIISPFTYILIIGIALRKNWARVVTIVMLLLPILLVSINFYNVGGRIGEINSVIINLVFNTLISLYLIYEYSANKKVKLYYSQ